VKHKPHHYHPLDAGHGKRTTTSLPWKTCCQCGLITLKNDATTRAMRAACPGSGED
jgi:hypothetical protein